MHTLRIMLPAAMKAFVEQQVAQGGYGNSSEYFRELIRRDQDRTQLRTLMLDGVGSATHQMIGPPYFDELRKQVRTREAS
jgi:antitoxin ParD1/3/4